MEKKQTNPGNAPGTQNLETLIGILSKGTTSCRKADIKLNAYTYGELKTYLDELRGLELVLSSVCDEPHPKQIIFFYESLGRLLDELEDSITIKEVSNNG